MSYRALLVLMIVFMVLGTFAIFDPLRRQEKAESARDREERVVWLEGKKLEAITIQGRHPTTRLDCAKKEGCPFDGTGEWLIAEPAPGGKGDPSAAGTLASSLLNLKHSEKLDFSPGQPDPAEFGLDHPRAEVLLKFVNEAAPLSLKFGKSAAVGPNVYLFVSSDPGKIFLVPSYMPDMVNKEPFHWQSKRLFQGVESLGFRKMGWSDTKSKLKGMLAEQSEGKWRLLKPVVGSANQFLFEGLASTLSYAAARSVWNASKTSTEARSLLGGKPELEIHFSPSNGSEHSLRLFARPSAGPDTGQPKQFVAEVDRDPRLYVVDAGTFDRFRKELNEYRQRSVLSDTEKAQVDEMRLVFPRDKNEATFQLKEGKWSQTGGAEIGDALSQERLNAFLDALRTSDFTGYFPKNGSSPEARSWKGAQPDLSLELRGGGKQVYAGSFVIQKKGLVVTEAEGELRTLGPAFLQLIPVRVSDLGETASKQVITSDDKMGHSPGGGQPGGPQEGGADGHDEHGHDPHAGHGH